MTQPALDQEQVEHFLNRGHVVIRGALPAEVCRRAIDHAFERLGYDRNDPTTWVEPKIHMGRTTTWTMEELAPRAWAAACQLMGGGDRVVQPYTLSDSYIVNLSYEKEKGWLAPQDYRHGGWHKDGDFFAHFLDSPEQGLLTLICWTDMVHRGGATFIACDSVPHVARYLNEHREGVDPNGFPIRSMIDQCQDLVEVQASAGDIILLHPYMLHASSPNVINAIRIITNPPLQLREPMCFDRDDPSQYSAVELAVLRGLGVDRLDFKPTGPRRRIVPERVARQQQMLAEERARAASRAGGAPQTA